MNPTPRQVHDDLLPLPRRRIWRNVRLLAPDPKRRHVHRLHHGRTDPRNTAPPLVRYPAQPHGVDARAHAREPLHTRLRPPGVVLKLRRARGGVGVFDGGRLDVGLEEDVAHVPLGEREVEAGGGADEVEEEAPGGVRGPVGVELGCAPDDEPGEEEGEVDVRRDWDGHPATSP